LVLEYWVAVATDKKEVNISVITPKFEIHNTNYVIVRVEGKTFDSFCLALYELCRIRWFYSSQGTGCWKTEDRKNEKMRKYENGKMT
jgi:hypothetical protein